MYIMTRCQGKGGKLVIWKYYMHYYTKNGK